MMTYAEMEAAVQKLGTALRLYQRTFCAQEPKPKSPAKRQPRVRRRAIKKAERMMSDKQRRHT